MKRILIAVPTNKYIEPETFKSIYDLKIPPGYQAEFQFFYGYQIDQIRNLIAEWAKRYDYLFSVDSDIIVPSDCLERMIDANVDIISGLYIQRKENEHVLEIFTHDARTGNIQNVPYEWIEHSGIFEISACGFGCVLIKGEVFRTLQYPHFVYISALDHKDTKSEDVYFCKKAKQAGFKVWADADIICDHVGRKIFKVRPKSKELTVDERLQELHDQRLLPRSHTEYLNSMGINPKVVFDIGAGAIHWTTEAKEVWPDSKFVLFEAMKEAKNLYEKYRYDYHLVVLSDEDNKIVKFYNRPKDFGGNSYYKERGDFFQEVHAQDRLTVTLDTLVRVANIPQPDLIKMDVQGAELDIIKGATKTLENCKDLILELQHVEYNQGAPLKDTVIMYLRNLGFELVTNFTSTEVDGDYHFQKI
jgi:FkbM family methyltransferase